MMKLIMRLQIAARRLKAVTSGDVLTHVIAVGIGKRVDNHELETIASPPKEQNVFHVEDFHGLPTIQAQLLDDTCRGKHMS